MNSARIEILLVEDSPTDQFLAQTALAEARTPNHVHVVCDGVEAMAFLRGEGQHSCAPRPDLILLDLNLPRKGGREVLAEIKTSESFKSIPVVVLTTSESADDVLQAYELHANCYISKPVDFDAFRLAVQSIQDFWFSTARLPGRMIHTGSS
jgi:two-component system, chemotaxis family, response regulator Rcp1